MSEVIRCSNPKCKLNQFLTEANACRRCKTLLRIPEAIPVPRGAGRPLMPINSSADKLHNNFALTLRLIRQSKNLSQRQLGARMGCPRTYISKVENGKAMPNLSSLERIAAALGMRMSGIIAMVEAMP